MGKIRKAKTADGSLYKPPVQKDVKKEERNDSLESDLPIPAFQSFERKLNMRNAPPADPAELLARRLKVLPSVPGRIRTVFLPLFLGLGFAVFALLFLIDYVMLFESYGGYCRLVGYRGPCSSCDMIVAIETAESNYQQVVEAPYKARMGTLELECCPQLDCCSYSTAEMRNGFPVLCDLAGRAQFEGQTCSTDPWECRYTQANGSIQEVVGGSSSPNLGFLAPAIVFFSLLTVLLCINKIILEEHQVALDIKEEAIAITGLRKRRDRESEKTAMAVATAVSGVPAGQQSKRKSLTKTTKAATTHLPGSLGEFDDAPPKLKRIQSAYERRNRRMKTDSSLTRPRDEIQRSISARSDQNPVKQHADSRVPQRRSRRSRTVASIRCDTLISPPAAMPHHKRASSLRRGHGEGSQIFLPLQTKSSRR